MKLWITLKFN